jgi:uncharacterized protein CbrC (UPF0167 family)
MTTVFSVETTAAMSEEDIADLCELFQLLEKRYHFRWSQTRNREWVRALARKMEAENAKVR